MELFSDKSSHPKHNAQRNLCGRTHYVDEETLRWHHSRVLSARVIGNGLLFGIITSDALDMNNTKRGYRFVLFNVFGTVVSRPERDKAGVIDSFRTKDQATKAMWAQANAIDAYEHTRTAIMGAEQEHAREMERLKDTVNALDKQFNAG